MFPLSRPTGTSKRFVAQAQALPSRAVRRALSTCGTPRRVPPVTQGNIGGSSHRPKHSPLGWASPHSKCNCGGAAPLIGLYSHRCPSRTGATERGSRPSPLGWASPHSKSNCRGAAPCRALLPPPSLSHRADPTVSRGCGRHPTPRPLFTREYPFRHPRRAKHISTTLAGPEEPDRAPWWTTR